MTRRWRRSVYFVILILFFECLPANGDEAALRAGTIHVEVGGFRNNSGEARVNLYNSKDGFPSQPHKAFMTRVSRIENDEARVDFKDIPFGEYAIAVLHDENGNKKMDFNWLMMPKEGIGASNNPKGVFAPPGFDEARFRLDADEISVKIRMRY